MTDATDFAALHVPGSPLVIPNAWDAASAAVLQAAGAPAIATTSGGVAWSLGYPDGNALPVDEAVAVVARMARVVSVPLSADIESGFSVEASAVADLVARVASAGAAGVNLEDSWDGALLPVEVQAARLRAVSERAPGVFVNARTDAFLLGLPDALEEAVRRGAAFAEAGAGALFVPGLTTLGQLAELVEHVEIPVSVMASAGGPSVADFASVGVARVSVGTDLADVAYGRLRADVEQVLADGTFGHLAGGYGYGELNALFR